MIPDLKSGNYSGKCKYLEHDKEGFPHHNHIDDVGINAVMDNHLGSNEIIK